MLKALCKGSVASGYCVTVMFDSASIISSSCTCYSNNLGPCKHIAALLTMWHSKPSVFLSKSEWVKRLYESKKDELISLIEKLEDMYPYDLGSHDPYNGKNVGQS